MLQTCHKVVPL